MIYFIKMKYEEWKFKWKFYKSANFVIDNYKDVCSISKGLFNSLKDVSVDNLREEFISKLAEIIHEENTGKTE